MALWSVRPLMKFSFLSAQWCYNNCNNSNHVGFHSNHVGFHGNEYQWLLMFDLLYHCVASFPGLGSLQHGILDFMLHVMSAVKAWD